jgi:hypothetical protein
METNEPINIVVSDQESSNKVNFVQLFYESQEKILKF